VTGCRRPSIKRIRVGVRSKSISRASGVCSDSNYNLSVDFDQILIFIRLLFVMKWKESMQAVNVIGFSLLFILLSGCGSTVTVKDPVKDPKSSFKEKIPQFNEFVKSVIQTEPSATYIGTKYDIMETKSIVTPYTGEIIVEFDFKVLPGKTERMECSAKYKYVDDNWSDAAVQLNTGGLIKLINELVQGATTLDEVNKVKELTIPVSQAVDRLNSKLVLDYEKSKKP
jgi:hypothetical protein